MHCMCTESKNSFPTTGCKDPLSVEKMRILELCISEINHTLWYVEVVRYCVHHYFQYITLIIYFG